MRPEQLLPDAAAITVGADDDVECAAAAIREGNVHGTIALDKFGDRRVIANGGSITDVGAEYLLKTVAHDCQKTTARSGRERPVVVGKEQRAAAGMVAGKAERHGMPLERLDQTKPFGNGPAAGMEADRIAARAVLAGPVDQDRPDAATAQASGKGQAGRPGANDENTHGRILRRSG